MMSRWGHASVVLGALFVALSVAVWLHPGPFAVDAYAHGAIETVDPGAQYQWGDSLGEEVIDFAVFGVLDALLFGALWHAASRRVAIHAGVLILAHQAFVWTLQAVMDRARPAGAYEPGGAFPSGHASHAALTVLLAAWVLWPALRPQTRLATRTLAAAILVCAFGIFRLLSAEHWLSDIAASAVLATAVASAFVSIHLTQAAPRQIHQTRILNPDAPHRDA